MNLRVIIDEPLEHFNSFKEQQNAELIYHNLVNGLLENKITPQIDWKIHGYTITVIEYDGVTLEVHLEDKENKL